MDGGYNCLALGEDAFGNGEHNRDFYNRRQYDINIENPRFHTNTYYASRLRASGDNFKVPGPSLC